MSQTSAERSIRSGAIARNSVIAAEHTVLIITPARIIVVLDTRPCCRESSSTTPNAPNAPRKLKTPVLQAAPSPTSIPLTAPSAAPPETPRIYGSASGLRNTA